MKQDVSLELQGLFAEHAPSLEVDVEAVEGSASAVRAFFQSQDFADHFGQIWQVFSLWQARGETEAKLEYWTEDSEMIEYDLVGWSAEEVLDYLRSNPPAGAQFDRTTQEDEPLTDSPPHVQLTFSW